MYVSIASAELPQLLGVTTDVTLTKQLGSKNPFYRFVTSGNRCIALHRSSVVKCVY